MITETIRDINGKTFKLSPAKFPDFMAIKVSMLLFNDLWLDIGYMLEESFDDDDFIATLVTQQLKTFKKLLYAK